MSTNLAQIDSTIDIVTPENISFNYRVAGPFRRMLAFAIDLGVRVVVFIAVGWLLSLTLGQLGFTGGALVGAIMLIVWFVMSWFYGGLFETFWNGQTPGKWMLGIRVLTIEGSPINGMQAVLRNILRIVDTMPMLSVAMFTPIAQGANLPPMYVIPTFMLGLGVMAMNRRFRRIGDFVCGTMVVREERSWLMGVAKLEDPRAAQLAEYLPPTYEVSRSLAKALAAYVERRQFFSPPRRREIARHLADPLLVMFELPSDTSHDLLLCALYYRTFVAEGADGYQSEMSPFAPQPGSPAAEGIQFVAPPLPQESMIGINTTPK